MPIDVKHVARLMGNDPQVLFGRLYYHLDQRYRYKQSDGVFVHLFTPQLGAAKHCINYPYLCALLADFREKHAESKRTFWVSIVALALSVGAIIAQVIS